MNVTLLLVLLVVFSYGVGHLVARYASRFLVFSGAEYLLVGVLIGPQIAPRLLSADALARLQPLVSLLLGLVGFSFGVSASRDLRRFRPAMAGVVSALAVVVLVCIALTALAVWIVPVDEADASFVLRRTLVVSRGWVVELYASSEHLWLGLGLGTAAAVGSTVSLELTMRHLRARGSLLDFLRVCAAASQITAVVVLGLSLAAARGADSAGKLGIGVTQWALAAAGAGIVCGLLFSLFIGRESDAPRIFLATIGCVIFASGIGSALGISPLFVNLVAGVVVAATSPHSGRLREELSRLRHPLFVMLTIFAGAMWIPASGWFWLFPAVYIAVRYVARRSLTALAARLFVPALSASRPGLGLLGQGMLALAIGINYAQRHPEHAALVLTTVIVATLLFDGLAVRWLRRVLLDAGEVDAVAPGEEQRTSLEPLQPASQQTGGST
jgi:Kef-type K+ transport system membrane component KefB